MTLNEIKENFYNHKKELQSLIDFLNNFNNNNIIKIHYFTIFINYINKNVYISILSKILLLKYIFYNQLKNIFNKKFYNINLIQFYLNIYIYLLKNIFFEIFFNIKFYIKYIFYIIFYIYFLIIYQLICIFRLIKYYIIFYYFQQYFDYYKKKKNLKQSLMIDFVELKYYFFDLYIYFHPIDFVILKKKEREPYSFNTNLNHNKRYNTFKNQYIYDEDFKQLIDFYIVELSLNPILKNIEFKDFLILEEIIEMYTDNIKEMPLSYIKTYIKKNYNNFQGIHKKQTKIKFKYKKKK